MTQAGECSDAGLHALRDLCAAYYGPVIAFLGHQGNDADAARELAHEFFARMLEGDAIGGADRAQGRFRSYLLGAVKHFVAHQRESEQRQRRGGGVRPLSIDEALPESPALQVADDARLSPDAAIAVNVLIVRAVRRGLVSAPPESSATGHEIKTASIAIILALIATALGALAAFRNEGAWPAMALSLPFAGMSIILALPVRRLGVGKCALIIAALGTVIWPLAALIVRQTRIAEGANVSGIAKVEVTEDRATISQPRYDLEGMLITFGPAGDRLTPAGVYLEAMFDVTLEPHLIGSGANWVMKTRHGTLSGYRLDGPPGPMLGKIVFHPGTPTPEADGAYVIGEFRPDKGGPLPIAVRLEKDSARTVAPPQSSPSGSVPQPEATKASTTPQAATDDSILTL